MQGVPSNIAFTPTSGEVGASVTITGKNFTGTTGTGVRFNSTTATSFSVDSDTQITAVVPAGATTGRISVTNSKGTGTSNATFSVIVAPHITSLSVSTGKVGAAVTINGTGFTGVDHTSGVTFNGTAATATVVSDTKITTTVPSGATTGNIEVENNAGFDSIAFTVILQPVITSFSPTAGAPGTSVSIHGSSFTGTTAVKFGTAVVSSQNFTIVSDLLITATVPPTATTGAITVTNPAGSTASSDTFTVAGPVVTGFTPSIGKVGDTVTINGKSFTAATSVEFTATGGHTVDASTFTVNSDTKITVTVPVGAITGKISVVDPVSTGTSPTDFTVVQGPSITSLGASSGKAGSSVTITGTGFSGTSSVKFTVNSLQVTGTFTVNSDTQITAKVPVAAATLTLAHRKGPITVTNASGSDSSTDFTVLVAPSISSFTPTHGPSATGHTTQIVITGNGFTDASQVKFGTAAGTLDSVDSDSQITATSPVGAKTGAISVVNPEGTGVKGTFTVDAPPTITLIAPSLAKVGDTVTITGSNLTQTGGVTVTFTTSTTPATATVVGTPTATQMKVTVPAGAITGVVTASNATTGSTTKAFTVVQGPSITSLGASSGKAGSSVTITGTGFSGTSSVKFTVNSLQVTGTFTVNSDTQITAKVPVAAATLTLAHRKGPITVTNASGSDSSTDFTVLVAPSISSFTPTHGPSATGHTTQIVITGNGFTDASQVKFGTAAGTLDSVDSDSQITATSPVGAKTGAISVVNPEGTGVKGTFTVDAPPTITLIAPSLAKVGDTVTITGSNLTQTGGVTVTFTTSTTPATATVVGTPTATQMKVTVPAGAITGVVTASNATTGSTTKAFTVVQGPSITSLGSSSGKAGSSVTITGTGFSGTSSVKFTVNSLQVTGTFTVNSDTQITAKVPVAAATLTLAHRKGPITVTNASGSDSSTDFTILVAPTITSFTPTHGPSSTGHTTQLTVTGNGFTGMTQVKFGTIAATDASITDDAHLTVTSPVGAKTGAISVVNPEGTGVKGTFTVDAPPTITLIAPSLAKVGDTVTITGSNLTQTGGVTVTFTTSTTPATATVVGTPTATQMKVTVPAGAITGVVTASNATTGSTTKAFTVVQGPSITSLGSSSGKAGSSVTITGTGFSGTSSVKFTVNSLQVTGTFTVNSDTQITAKVPVAAATLTLAHRKGPITVTNASGSDSSTDFTVLVAPSISSFTPTHGPSATGHTTQIVITGNGFTDASQVKFGTAAGTLDSVDSDSQITATSPVGAKTGAISVVNPEGTGVKGTFTVDAPPTITLIAPSLAKVGDTVTITGSNLTQTGGVTVTFTTSTTPATATVVGTPTATQMKVTVPAGAITGVVTASNATTGSTTKAFTVVQGPSITSLGSSSGKAGSSVTITGTGFSGTSSVKFTVNSLQVTGTFTVNSDTQITAKVPVAAATLTLAHRKGPITVTNASGSDSSTDFTVLVAPSISSFTPTHGPASGNGTGEASTNLTIHGNGFTGATQVLFNGVAATSVAVTDDATITATTPTGGTTTGKITVTTPTGSGSSTTTFVVDPKPSITTFTTSAGIGQTVTINGAHFDTTDTSVAFNGTDVTSSGCGSGGCITAVTATKITVTVPDAATSGPITVTNGVGESTDTPGYFTVVPAPSVTSFSPTSGPVGTSVTITGSHLSGATEVDFNTKKAVTFHVDSDTQITATVPTGATTGKITVKRPSGSGTSATNFTVS